MREETHDFNQAKKVLNHGSKDTIHPTLNRKACESFSMHHNRTENIQGNVTLTTFMYNTNIRMKVNITISNEYSRHQEIDYQSNFPNISSNLD